MPIDITPSAVQAIQSQLLKRKTPQARLRVGIKGGGCSGFTYVIQYDDDAPRPRDTLLSIDGVEILVDPKSAVYLRGSILDYETTMVKSGFKFINDQEKSRCGCGTSFSVK